MNDKLTAAIKRLKSLNEPVPRPLRLPTPEEVEKAETLLGIKFPGDYRRFLLEASDVVFGTKEPATLTRPESHTHFEKVCEAAWNSYGVPRELLPICEDNADFYCLKANGEVLYWSHNGWAGDSWPDLATWIVECWIGESI